MPGSLYRLRPRLRAVVFRLLLFRPADDRFAFARGLAAFRLFARVVVFPFVFARGLALAAVFRAAFARVLGRGARLRAGLGPRSAGASSVMSISDGPGPGTDMGVYGAGSYIRSIAPVLPT